MNYKEFFTTNNKSGWKCRESVLEKNEPEIFVTLKKFIIENNLNDLPFKQQVWHFINNEPNRMICKGCGEQTVHFRDSLMKGYHQYCNLDCANKNGDLGNKASKALELKYGVKYFSQHESFEAKVKKTKLEKYGDENYNNYEKGLKTKELKTLDPNYVKPIYEHNLLARKKYITDLETTIPDKVIKFDLDDEKVNLQCFTCSNTYLIDRNLLKYRIQVNVKPCTSCNPISSVTSIQEKELQQYIKTLLPNELVYNNDKKLIKLELDVYLPNRNIAIEYNGSYWHSEEYIDKNYHLNKTKLCNEKNVDLIHIFDDEWINKKEIVKSIICNKLGIITNKIFARKTELKQVSIKDTKLFLSENHIQGYVNDQIRIGLYNNDELISIMTFGSNRKVLGGHRTQGNYELLRFANKINVTVIGAFSKLLNYFKKNYEYNSILTYSDIRYFNGDIYKNNGFTLKHISKPGYTYLINHKREHRFKYRKDRLVKEGFDINKTEHEIMLSRGIYRVYDCGNKVWLLTK